MFDARRKDEVVEFNGIGRTREGVSVAVGVVVVVGGDDDVMRKVCGCVVMVGNVGVGVGVVGVAVVGDDLVGASVASSCSVV